MINIGNPNTVRLIANVRPTVHVGFAAFRVPTAVRCHWLSNAVGTLGRPRLSTGVPLSRRLGPDWRPVATLPPDATPKRRSIRIPRRDSSSAASGTDQATPPTPSTAPRKAATDTAAAKTGPSGKEPAKPVEPAAPPKKVENTRKIIRFGVCLVWNNRRW
jgi:hypothetical protein